MLPGTPTPEDWRLALPFIDAYRVGTLSRRGYWRRTLEALSRAHPDQGRRELERRARMMAPFALRQPRRESR